MLQKLFEGFDIMDLTIILVLVYLLIVTTLGFANQDIIDSSIKWIGLILAYLLGKKTPQKL